MIQIIFLRTTLYIYILPLISVSRITYLLHCIFCSVSGMITLFSRFNVQSLYRCIFTNPQTFIYLHIEMRPTMMIMKLKEA